MWLQSPNGGTSVAAEEVADDSNQSIKQEGLKPAAKDPVSELAKVSCSHNSSTCYASYNIPAVSVLSPLLHFFCFLRKYVYMHDPQGEVESKKEGLKSQEGLEPGIKNPVAEVAKVGRSHEHMLSQPQHSCCHCSVSCVAFPCFLRKIFMILRRRWGQARRTSRGKRAWSLLPMTHGLRWLR